MSILFLISVFFFFLVSFIVPDKTFSYNENRSLAQRPEFNKETVFDGSYMKNYETYVTDQMLWRDWFVQFSTNIKLLLGQKEINNVYISNNYLVEKFMEADIDQEVLKENQEHILAIDIKREAFVYLVSHAVISTYSEDLGISQGEWKEQIQRSDIRCQWDPERDIYGNPLDYRSIQLGLRGDALHSYVNEWIVSIEDITEYVADLYIKRNSGIDISELLPTEQVYSSVRR